MGAVMDAVDATGVCPYVQLAGVPVLGADIDGDDLLDVVIIDLQTVERENRTLKGGMFTREIGILPIAFRKPLASSRDEQYDCADAIARHFRRGDRFEIRDVTDPDDETSIYTAAVPDVDHRYPVSDDENPDPTVSVYWNAAKKLTFGDTEGLPILNTENFRLTGTEGDSTTDFIEISKPVSIRAAYGSNRGDNETYTLPVFVHYTAVFTDPYEMTS